MFANLHHTLSNIPGICKVNICTYPNHPTVNVFFSVTDVKGLILLTRCVDRRYWEYGHKWSIKLSIMDAPGREYLPISFHLESQDSVEDASIQVDSLIKSINDHVADKKFMATYGLIEAQDSKLGAILKILFGE